MGLIRWEPMHNLESIMDRAFNWPLTRAAGSLAPSEWGPRVDISESDGSYLVTADIPGMDKQDIKVSLEGDLLTIEGERRRQNEERQPRFHRIERSYGQFSRSFTLPGDADPTAIHAHAENGELRIRIARKAGADAEESAPIPVD